MTDFNVFNGDRMVPVERLNLQGREGLADAANTIAYLTDMATRQALDVLRDPDLYTVEYAPPAAASAPQAQYQAAPQRQYQQSRPDLQPAITEPVPESPDVFAQGLGISPDEERAMEANAQAGLDLTTPPQPTLPYDRESHLAEVQARVAQANPLGVNDVEIS